MKKIEVVFENNHFLAVIKPAAMLSVPSRLGDRDKRPVIKKLLETQTKVKIWPVHRLDFEVSGLMIFAKTSLAHQEANSWFEKHHIQKTYAALTDGDPVAAEAFKEPSEWRCYLVRGKKRAFEAPYGQLAITQARCLGLRTLDSRSLLEWRLQPQTGRNHQLRFELFKRNFPITGDELYGSKTVYGANAIALESISLNFTACPDYQTLGLPETIDIKPSWAE